VEWNFISEKLSVENIQLCFKINNNKINYVPSQTNIKMYFFFFALLATSFGHYGHHQANFVHTFKKGWLHEVRKMLRCVEPHLQ